MLEIKNIKKSYRTANFKQIALNNVSLKFRQSEFVSILGQSGSGKTTLLNIISGLDRYDSGDLIINGKSTKKFKDRDWDAYRNNSIGFIFQSYNLIPHISILKNVEMGMTLSGVKKEEKNKKALEALEKVGLKEHINKKPNQLSGGQMQRVAIARALANDPDIILADEPTGALDSKTSVQIMELIKEIAKDKLVIMVTHNPELAKKYSSRIIELSDGEIISDSNPYTDETSKKNYSIRKTAMSFLTAISLSFQNIKTKKGRTLLTAFASSIGIIGISIILALSNGFDQQIDIFESDTLSSFPIIVAKQSTQVDADTFMEMHNQNNQKVNSNKIYSYDKETNSIIHTNKINKDYINYVENLSKETYDAITYIKTTNMNILPSKTSKAIVGSSSLGMQSLPNNLQEITPYMNTNYELLSGKIPTKKEEVLLYIDQKNRIDKSILETLNVSNQEEYNFEEFLNKELQIITNDDYYQKQNNMITINQDINQMSNSKNTITIKIVGIVKAKEDNAMARIQEMGYNQTTGGILYPSELLDEIISINKDSTIVKEQEKLNYNILTRANFEDEDSKETILSYLGKDSTPIAIYLYPKDFKAKDSILSYLDSYNKNKEKENQILYTDMAKSIVNASSGIMDAITYVLIAFSAISLVVSGIMIGIITYISVLERTKEIGILRSLGARKKDITRVFNAETFLIGLTSGLLGIGIAYLSLFPINSLLEKLTDLAGIAKMSIVHVIIMLLVSITITLVGGYIPAKIASKKDPVEALRTE